MEAADALLVEYSSVRQESLEALAQIHTIIQYGLASIGVTAGLGLVTAEHNLLASAVVLMVMIPTVIVFGDVMLAVSAHRVIQSRLYLRRLEKTISNRLSARGDLIGWERDRTTSGGVAPNAYPFAIFASVGAQIVFGPVLGGILLARAHHWVWFGLGESVDVIGIGTFAVRATATYRRLVALNVTAR
jgi:hypothetical protein